MHLTENYSKRVFNFIVKKVIDSLKLLYSEKKLIKNIKKNAIFLKIGQKH